MQRIFSIASPKLGPGPLDRQLSRLLQLSPTLNPGCIHNSFLVVLV